MEFKSYIGYDFGQPEVFSGGGQAQAADDSPPVILPDEGIWIPGQDSQGFFVDYGYVIDTTRGYKVDKTYIDVSGGSEDNPMYVFLRVPHSGGPSISRSATYNLPIPVKNEYRHPLLEVGLDNGSIVVFKRLCTNIIVIPGLMSRL